MSNAANTVSLNGQSYEVLPLNWKQLKEHRADIVVINDLKPNQGLFTEEQQDAILNVTTASIQRRHETVDKAFVEKWLDLGNVGEILQMVFGAAKKASGDGAGEA